MGPGTSSSLAVNVERAGEGEASIPTTIVEQRALPVVAALLEGLLASDQGGFFPTAWGWGALAALWMVALWLLVGKPTGGRRLDVLMIGLLGAVAAWTALSILWSDSPSSSVLETERAVLYVSALAAVLLLTRRPQLHRLVGAVFVALALVALYSLCTRLFPDRLGFYDPAPYARHRLSDPIGYWNGLGLFAAFGVLLALGFAARGRSTTVRLSSAASLAILVPTLYFTFSRGSWIALGVGLACAFAYDPRRLQLASTALLIAPGPIVATFLATHSHGWTATEVSSARAIHDGHRLALAILILIPATALGAYLQVLLERRLRPAEATKRAFGAILLAIVVGSAAVAIVNYGGPSKAVSRAYDAFKADPSTTNARERLLTLSSDGRIDLWRVAWREYEQHTALGSGAGTFSRYWYRYRPFASFDSQEPFSLYLQTLAELGPLGLVFLVTALLVPLLAAAFVRREPLAAVLLAAYVAFLVHAGADWDFELPGVSLAGLFCGASLIVAARGDATARVLRGPVRTVGIVIAATLSGFALWGLIGNSALAASREARDQENWAKAENQARKARDLMPWSPEPWEALGFAQAARGDLDAARRSFREAVDKDPGDWTLWLDLAVVRRGQERKEALAQARRLNPDSPEVREVSSRSG